MGCPGCVDVVVLLAGHSVPCVVLCHLDVQQHVWAACGSFSRWVMEIPSSLWRVGRGRLMESRGVAHSATFVWPSTKASFSPRDAKEHGLGPQIFLLKNNSGTAPGVRKDIMIWPCSLHGRLLAWSGEDMGFFKSLLFVSEGWQLQHLISFSCKKMLILLRTGVLYNLFCMLKNSDFHLVLYDQCHLNASSRASPQVLFSASLRLWVGKNVYARTSLMSATALPLLLQDMLEPSHLSIPPTALRRISLERFQSSTS